MLSYIPPSRTQIPQDILQRAKEGLTKVMPVSQWSTQRGDGAPDIDIDAMHKANPHCNYLFFERKYGHYIQNTPCQSEARLAAKAATEERVWKRAMACETYAAAYVPGTRQVGTHTPSD